MMRWVILAVVICLAAPVRAQVNVRLDLERERYLLYEPMTATVEVQNYSAGQVELTEQESTPWLRFEITRSTGEQIGPVGPGFLAGAVTLRSGQAGARSVNLVAYYQIRAPGRYRIRALARVAGVGGSFASRERSIEVVAGKQMLSKSSGFKDETGKLGLRNYSLIEVLLGRQVWLYARVEDATGDNIYGVIPLGEWVTFREPTAATDTEGNFHVLHQQQPRLFRHSVISPAAAVVRRESFSNYNAVPELVRSPDGGVKVLGGESLDRSSIPAVVPKAP